MAADQALRDAEPSRRLALAIDQVIAFFNSRRMDLPDGFFDRRTQFVSNGATFESLLSTTPNDPLVMMLARGPAGYRFAAKALQHAMPDASIRLTPSSTESRSISASAPNVFTFQLRVSGTLRGTGEAVDAVAAVTLRLAETGHVDIAEAVMDPAVLQSIREARVKA